METTSTKPGQPGLTKLRIAMIAGGIMAIVAAAGAATHWVHVQDLDTVNAATPSAGDTPMRVRVTAPPPVVTTALHTPEAVHTDIYFDVKSTRLRADAVKVLQEQVARMDKDGGWAALVHGYTDRQGSPEYNKQLAQRRAESVKQFMVELGLPESSIRTVTVGPDGALCEETTRECQQLNRRVHIEMRKLAQGARPVPAAASPAEVFQTHPAGVASQDGR